MRIALNLLFLLPGVVGGTETYARLLIEQLTALDKTNDYLLILNEECRELTFARGGNFRSVVLPVRATNRAARYFWEQTILPHRLRVENVDILHSLGYVGPLRPSCAHVVTIHDVNYQNPAVQIPSYKRRILGGFVTSVARRADHIITVSDFSKRQIVDLLRVPARKITTTHLAANPRSAAYVDSELPELRPGGSDRQPYIIAFGGTAPHKNLPRLIAAFAEISSSVAHQLIVVGAVPPDGSINAAIDKHDITGRVRVTGYLSEDVLTATLAGADLLAFPSLYEGFGLPVLDAQAAGVAIVCSSAGSLPEIAGDGALFFEPESTPSISAALLKALSDATLRRRLVSAGYDNVRRFSWARTAATTLSVYERLATGVGRPSGLQLADHVV